MLTVPESAAYAARVIAHLSVQPHFATAVAECKPEQLRALATWIATALRGAANESSLAVEQQRPTGKPPNHPRPTGWTMPQECFTEGKELG